MVIRDCAYHRTKTGNPIDGEAIGTNAVGGMKAIHIDGFRSIIENATAQSGHPLNLIKATGGSTPVIWTQDNVDHVYPSYNPLTAAAPHDQSFRRGNNWAPAQNALLAANGDPGDAAQRTPQQTSGGFVIVARIWVPRTITVANIEMYLKTVGVTLTSNQNFAGLYSSSGTLIAKTADQSANWVAGSAPAGVGLKTMALTAESGQSLTLTGGPGAFVYGAVLTNGSTQPTFSALVATSTDNNAMANLHLDSTSGFRGAFKTTGTQTSLPAPLGTLTSTGWGVLWFGLT
jgi:hypothetical protein